jgi:hypothetical protein
VITSSFIFSHSLLVNSSLSLLVSISCNVVFELLLPKHRRYLPLPSSLLIPLNVHNFANNHAVPSLSFLVQHNRVHEISCSNYNSCLHRELIKDFQHSLHRSLPFLIITAFFSSLLISLKLHTSWFCYTDANLILSSFPLNSLVQLLLFLYPFGHP